MPIAASARIHPTAIVSEEATIGENVEIGPYAIVDGPVVLGADSIVRARGHLIGPMTVGIANDIGIGVVLGERPQHLLYKGEPTTTEIGDHNIFREYVTIHRGTPVGGGVTRIGSHNFIMANTHIGHDAHVGDRCIFANSALVAGHAVINDRVLMSGNTCLHQFARLGRLALISALSAASRDVPPFVIVFRRDEVCGVNVIGMRRAGLPAAEIAAVREAFRLIYRQNLMLSVATQRLERDMGHVPAVMEMVQFIRGSKRGVLGGHHRMRDAESEAA